MFNTKNRGSVAVVALVAAGLSLLLGVVGLGAVSGKADKSESFGGSVYNRVIEFSEGITVDTNTVIDGSGALTSQGDMTISGTTPFLTIGDAGAEDAAVVFDGNAQDFYVGLDDTADDLVFGLGSALGTTQALGIDENLLVTMSGGVLLNGTTPTLTVGDAGAEDTSVVFDGNAQDFYIGLDDTADDLVFGLGSALGTTQALGIDENLGVTLGGQLFTSAASAPVATQSAGTPSLTAGSTDVAGYVTSDTTSHTTVIITFATAFTNAPFCVISAGDAEAAAIEGSATGVYAATSTTALTITHAADTTAAEWAYHCIGY